MRGSIRHPSSSSPRGHWGVPSHLIRTVVNNNTCDGGDDDYDYGDDGYDDVDDGVDNVTSDLLAIKKKG